MQSAHNPDLSEVYKKIIEDNKEEDKIEDASFDQHLHNLKLSSNQDNASQAPKKEAEMP